MKRLFTVAVLGWSICASHAYAAPVTVEYTATIRYLTDGNNPISASDVTGFNIAVGENVTGYFSYDSETQMISDGPGLDGQYLLIGNFSQALKFANSDRAITFNYDNYLRTNDDTTPQLIYAEGYDSAASNYKINTRFERFGEHVNSQGFLPEPGLWSQFGGNSYFDMWYHTSDFQSHVNVGADITSFRVVSSVPEPTTAAMLVLGIGLLASARRVRNGRA